MSPSPRAWAVYAAVAVMVAIGAWFIVATPVAPSRVPSDPATITLPATLNPAQDSATAGPGSQRVCRPGEPARLIIPSLGVDAPFERIGLDQQAPADAEGRRPLGNPTDRTKAGWYADGPEPGSGRGTVLTNGHTYRNNSAIFNEDFASTIAVGQLIHIETTDGSTCSYVVSRVWPEVNSATDYPRIVASEHLYDTAGPERLFLTTCGGSWNSAAQSYDEISLLIATPVLR
ncbi:MAG: class F sortase [Dermatophilaceae bacterium]